MFRTIRRWLARLFNLGHNPQRRRSDWPTLEEIARLPPFEPLGLGNVVEVATPEEAERARREILAHGVVGFDTESKPTFVKGEVSTGPHVAQFSTVHRAYIFMLHDRACRRVAAELIGSTAVKKVGFGLAGDLRQLPRKLGVQPREVLDLENLFAQKGYGRGVGVKVGVAIALERRFSKSKKASTSNWMRRRLSDKQILYAANDAFAALRVFHALKT